MRKIILITAMASLTLGVLGKLNMAYSQSIAPEILAVSGDYFTGTNATLSWTIGESVTETFSSANAILTQGFHQTSLTVTGIKDIDKNFSVSVYPNPVMNQLTVELEKVKRNYSIEITDLNGKLISVQKINSTHSTIDVITYSAGVYFLNLKNENNQLIKTFKIQKI